MGHEGVKNDRTGSGKAMETLPGPKTAIKNSKIQKLVENSKIGILGNIYTPQKGSLENSHTHTQTHLAGKVIDYLSTQLVGQ